MTTSSIQRGYESRAPRRKRCRLVKGRSDPEERVGDSRWVDGSRILVAGPRAPLTDRRGPRDAVVATDGETADAAFRGASNMSSSQRRQMMQPWPLCLVPLSRTKVSHAIFHVTRIRSIATNEPAVLRRFVFVSHRSLSTPSLFLSCSRLSFHDSTLSPTRSFSLYRASGKFHCTCCRRRSCR